MLATVATPLAAYRPLAHRHKWLLQIIVSFADKQGRCWPSLRTIAEAAGESLSSVQRNLAEMESLGYFVRRRRWGGSFVYRVAERFLPRWPGSEKREKPKESQRRDSKTPSPTRRTAIDPQPGVPPVGTEGIQGKESQDSIPRGKGLARRCAPPKVTATPEGRKESRRQLVARWILARFTGERRSALMMQLWETDEAFNRLDRQRQAENWDDRAELAAAVP